MDGPIRRNQLEQELSEKKALVTKRETNVKTVSQELIKVIDVLSGKDFFIKNRTKLSSVSLFRLVRFIMNKSLSDKQAGTVEFFMYYMKIW
jgi:hypothetical protein